MKKLSELMAMATADSPVKTTIAPKPTLVLFDRVLDSNKVLKSKEVDRIVNYFFGRSIASVLQPDNEEQLHDWFRDSQYKSSVLGRGMIYPIKADFSELTLETHSDQFSAPAYIQINTPEETVLPVLTITCQWYDGIFRNDYYVIGAVIVSADLENVLDS